MSTPQHCQGAYSDVAVRTGGLVRGGDGGRAGKPYSLWCNRVFVSDCPTARATVPASSYSICRKKQAARKP